MFLKAQSSSITPTKYSSPLTGQMCFCRFSYCFWVENSEMFISSMLKVQGNFETLVSYLKTKGRWNPWSHLTTFTHLVGVRKGTRTQFSKTPVMCCSLSYNTASLSSFGISFVLLYICLLTRPHTSNVQKQSLHLLLQASSHDIFLHQWRLSL